MPLIFMEYNSEKKEIILNKEVSNLDRFVIDFCSLLEDYVVVSGYVSILFGRSRATEDVDLLIKVENLEDFKKQWEKITENEFECINTSKPEEAFSMLNETAIRFSRKGKAIPNMEFKKISQAVHKYSFDNKIKVIIGEKVLFVSPLEMQIAYKLMLGKQGNNKDIEDAKHLYDLFEEKLNKEELLRLVKEMDAEKEFEKIK